MQNIHQSTLSSDSRTEDTLLQRMQHKQKFEHSLQFPRCVVCHMLHVFKNINGHNKLILLANLNSILYEND